MAFLANTRTATGLAPRSGLSLHAVFQVRRERRALCRLDDRALADIGLTRAEARAEARRPLWDIPTGRVY